jgi:hypothetical protein
MLFDENPTGVGGSGRVENFPKTSGSGRVQNSVGRGRVKKNGPMDNSAGVHIAALLLFLHNIRDCFVTLRNFMGQGNW